MDKVGCGMCAAHRPHTCFEFRSNQCHIKTFNAQLFSHKVGVLVIRNGMIQSYYISTKEDYLYHVKNRIETTFLAEIVSLSDECLVLVWFIFFYLHTRSKKKKKKKLAKRSGKYW